MPTVLNLKSQLNTMETTIAEKLVEFAADARHTSGDVRVLYMTLNLRGVGGSGEALRPRTLVYGSSVNSAHGAHVTMQVAAGGAISGLGVGLRATLEAAAATRTLTGTLAALQVDGNIGANNTLPGPTSLIRLAKAGSVDVPFFLDISDDQCLKGNGTLGANAADALAVRMPDGSTKYIPLFAAG